MDGKPWRIELLGEIRARYRDGEWIPLPYQKPVVLLLYLAAYPQRPHPREALVEILWPESDPEAGRRNLRVALYSFRRLLESGGASADELLLAERTTLRLDPAAFTTDLEKYLAAVSEAARAQTSVDRSQALGHAAACYTGEFLPGFNDAWVFEERERLLTTQREVLQRLVRAREELGDEEGALSAAREMVGLDPLWEEAHYEVMRLYAALGQPSACLRQYQELERVLRDELNETPSAEARALAEELRESARTLVVARRSPQAPPPALPLETVPLPAVPPPPQDPELPGRPAAAPHPRLPVQLTRFYGREEEIARLTELLASPVTRLVTVTGSGGSGKTRLAIAAAGRMVEADLGASPFPEAVTFVALADLADASRIPDAIVEALGLVRSPEVEAMEQVITQLSARPWLLVLDNFEHLVEGDGGTPPCALTAEGFTPSARGPGGALLVRTLLERAPRLTCLVTSRYRLGLSGEQEFALLPLPTPRRGTALTQLDEYASVQLFLDRARAVRAGFALTAENAASVAELCDRLEGLPLALELAAARAGILTPRQMLEQLEQRFAFLVSRQRDVPQRHRTLRAAIEGSYQSLTPDLRRFFTRLSVFRGGWTLDAAQAVCSQEGPADGAGYRLDSDPAPNPRSATPDAIECLEQLRDYSLIVVEERGGEVRYRLLETLREYGWERLAAAGELSTVRRRHSEWYLQLAERAFAAADGPEMAVWLTCLEAEQDNLRAVLAWCQAADADPESESVDPGSTDRPLPAAVVGLRLATALWWFWFRRGSLAEGLQWLEGALARGGDLPASLRAPALLRSAYLVHARGERERAESLLHASRQEYEKALALARASGARREIADASLALTEATVRTLDAEGARRYAAEARQQMEALGDRGGLIRTIYLIASLALSQGEWQTARPLMEELISLCRELGDSEHLIHALGAMGHLARGEGDTASARSWYAESLMLRRRMGNQFALAQSLEDFAVLAGREQQAERAIRLLGAEEAFCETLGARLPVTNVQDYERTVAEGRAALGDAAFAAVWAEGRALSLQQAVDYALGET